MDTAKKITSTRQYLSFGLGKEIFAVDVVKAREVLDDAAVTKVPHTPEFMLGVINLRGSVVPVVDLRLKFGMKAGERTRDTCIIVLEIDVDGETAVVGALVDSVREVMELKPEQVEPPPRIGARLRTEFIRGMGNREDGFLILLDIDRVFSSDELALVRSVEEEALAARIQQPDGGSKPGKRK